MKDDNYVKSSTAVCQSGVDLSGSVTVRLKFLKSNLDFKLYVSDN
jgi:hypothetical protein